MNMKHSAFSIHCLVAMEFIPAKGDAAGDESDALAAAASKKTLYDRLQEQALAKADEMREKAVEQVRRGAASRRDARCPLPRANDWYMPSRAVSFRRRRRSWASLMRTRPISASRCARRSWNR